jgi:hypothetical protein
MAGVVLGSSLSGWLASRTGRLRPWVAIGVALMMVGFGWTATFGPDTPMTPVIAAMVVLGAGIGPTNALLTLAVQNALPAALLGVVTSANQFFRSIGGTLGVTVFGSLVAFRMRTGLSERLPDALAQAPPAAREALADPNLLTDPARLASVRAAVEPLLGPEGVDRVLSASRTLLGSAVSEVFLVALAVTALALIAAARLPGVERPEAGEARGTTAAAPAGGGRG